MEINESQLIRVEVVFALPDKQSIISLSVERGCTAKQAMELSGFRKNFPGKDFDTLSMGIFSRPLNGIELPLPEEYVLEENDRVEIYRPLARDPKQTRLDRAKKNSKSGKNGTAKKGTAKKGTAKKGTAKKGTAKKGTAKKGVR
jgi:putative ubiquitin-RnfH superfamily antitoxin RatB of RatAB toxin-antitoxin module